MRLFSGHQALRTARSALRTAKAASAAERLERAQALDRPVGALSELVVRVLTDRCAHLGGPLHQGRVADVAGAACVTCPWHGSTFRLSDGAVRHGPSTARQPAFEARVSDSGQV